MYDALKYWSMVIHVYLNELRQIERDFERAIADRAEYSYSELYALAAAKNEIATRIARAINYLGGLGAAW